MRAGESRPCQTDIGWRTRAPVLFRKRAKRMPVAQLARDPVRLSVFAVNLTSGRPIQRLPIYAEIVWTQVAQPPPAPPPSDRFNTLIARALSLIDSQCANHPACLQRVAE